ncbi:hypothetical protein BC936DRAFT_146704 [Jimgerdemannia flammicorona]|uniref:Uncharacterized protein n=1 Tax=Jimgerdemannia flammicorona TaxID=994334 RepID=A0A433D706_9FUNG|nr:hypothetical protein BC936DRAFT_146704 [Jimgerdemannia flammicorona]
MQVLLRHPPRVLIDSTVGHDLRGVGVIPAPLCAVVALRGFERIPIVMGDTGVRSESVVLTLGVARGGFLSELMTNIDLAIFSRLRFVVYGNADTGGAAAAAWILDDGPGFLLSRAIDLGFGRGSIVFLIIRLVAGLTLSLPSLFPGFIPLRFPDQVNIVPLPRCQYGRLRLDVNPPNSLLGSPTCSRSPATVVFCGWRWVRAREAGRHRHRRSPRRWPITGHWSCVSSMSGRHLFWRDGGIYRDSVNGDGSGEVGLSHGSQWGLWM